MSPFQSSFDERRLEGLLPPREQPPRGRGDPPPDDSTGAATLTDDDWTEDSEDFERGDYFKKHYTDIATPKKSYRRNSANGSDGSHYSDTEDDNSSASSAPIIRNSRRKSSGKRRKYRDRGESQDRCERWGNRSLFLLFIVVVYHGLTYDRKKFMPEPSVVSKAARSNETAAVLESVLRMSSQKNERASGNLPIARNSSVAGSGNGSSSGVKNLQVVKNAAGPTTRGGGSDGSTMFRQKQTSGYYSTEEVALTERVHSKYAETYFRWNHPFRKRESTGVSDVPVFWRIPGGMSITVERIMSDCYGLVLASAIGVSGGHQADKSLEIFKVGGGRYVNVDMSNPAGIERAKSMHIGSSDLVDAISTPYLYDAADIFTGIPEFGKCFTMLQHPVERAVAMYHDFQMDSNNNHPKIGMYKGLSIDEYAERASENNWMTRFLTGRYTGNLEVEDLEAAKEVFGRKCLIGLAHKLEESLERYKKYFRWEDSVTTSETEKDVCIRRFLDESATQRSRPSYEGFGAWEKLRKKNEFDVLLYEHAKKLYKQQTMLHEARPL